MFIKKPKQDAEVMPETIGEWEMLDEAAIEQSAVRLSSAFPDSHLAPIARRLDNGLLACFDKGSDGTGKSIVLVQEDGIPGVVQRYATFLQWFDAALAEARKD